LNAYCASACGTNTCVSTATCCECSPGTPNPYNCLPLDPGQTCATFGCQ
jgi:hypothetical protein